MRHQSSLCSVWFGSALLLRHNCPNSQIISYYSNYIDVFQYLFQGIWIFSLVQYQPFSVAGYEYPTWAIVLGWIIAVLSIVCIPAALVHSIATAEGKTLWQVMRHTVFCWGKLIHFQQEVTLSKIVCFSLLKGTNLKGMNLLPLGANSFLLE